MARLVIHHLVAGIDERAAGEIKAFADADGDDDFVFRRVADVEILPDVFADGAGVNCPAARARTGCGRWIAPEIF